MALESTGFINTLNASWPIDNVDYVSAGGDHIKLIKQDLLNTFPRITGAVGASHLDLTNTTFIIDTSTSVNTVTLNPTTAWTSQTVGMGFLFQVNPAKTGVNTGPVWLTVSGFGGTLNNLSGSALVGGELQAGSIYRAAWDGSNYCLSQDNAYTTVNTFQFNPAIGVNSRVQNNSTGQLTFGTNGNTNLQLNSDGSTSVIGQLWTVNTDVNTNLTVHGRLGLGTSGISPYAGISANWLDTDTSTNSISGSLITLSTTAASGSANKIALTGGVGAYTGFNGTSLLVGVYGYATQGNAGVNVYLMNAGLFDVYSNGSGTISYSQNIAVGYAFNNNTTVVNSTGLQFNTMVCPTGVTPTTSAAQIGISDITGTSYSYGIWSGVSAGTNKWNIYAVGTASNYFAGEVITGYTTVLGGAPAVAGQVTAPTPLSTDNSQQVATTAFVQGLLNKVTTVVRQRRGYFNHFVQTSDNKIYSWGQNGSLALGQGSAGGNELAAEIQFPTYLTTNGYTIVDFTVAVYSCYVLWSNGDLYGWGDNGFGELGVGNTTNYSQPICIAGPNSNNSAYNPGNYATAPVTTAVSTLYYCPNGYEFEQGNYVFMFLKTTSGSFYFAGYGADGVQGNGNTAQQSTWTAVTPPSGKTISQIWVGSYTYGNAFCKTSDGYYYATGYNGNGELGIGTSSVPNTTNQTSWQNISVFSNTVNITDIQSNGVWWNGSTSYEYKSTSFLSSTGNVYMTGWGGDGTIGNGGTSNVSYPYLVNLSSKVVTKVIKGAYQVWVIFNDNSYARWGNNQNGQLGIGNTTQQNSPVFSSSSDPGGQYVTNIFANTETGADIWQEQTYLLKSNGLYFAGYNSAGSGGIGNNLINATVSAMTIVPLNNISIQDIKLSGNGNSCSAVITYTNTNEVMGAGNNTNYELNNVVTSGGKYCFKNLGVVPIYV